MKKYLKSVEEVVKALKEGIKVWDEECNSYFQIINGFITEFSKGDNNIITVNSNIFFIKNKDRYYTEEPEPLKFEVNRAYKTRGIGKVFLDRIDDDNNLHFFNQSYNYTTNLLGLYKSDRQDNFDIVGYWEKEK